MKVSQLPKIFLGIMDELVKPEGFKRKKSEHGYNKWINDELCHRFYLSFISHPGVDYDISVNVGVNHLSVERLLRGYKEGVSLSELKEGSTYGDKLKEGIHSIRWTIDFESDFEEVACSIWETVKKKGTPFWDKYSDMKEILKELYSPDPKDWKCGYVGRARLIPVIEAVLGEKERCVQSFRQLYRETKEKAPENFGGLVEEEYLKMMRYICSQIGMDSPY